MTIELINARIMLPDEHLFIKGALSYQVGWSSIIFHVVNTDYFCFLAYLHSFSPFILFRLCRYMDVCATVKGRVFKHFALG